MSFTEDFSRTCATYGLTRTLRFMVADRRGRGLYAPAFDRTKSVFIHVPKAAGSSVARTLYGKETRHFPAFVYRAINPRKFAKYFTFGIVRNPWDRAVSAFYYLKQGGKSSSDQAWAEAHLADFDDFDGFVKGWLSDNNLFKGVHFQPQHHFLCDSAGQIMVQHIVKLERIERDFSQISVRLGINNALRRDNTSAHEDYRQYYTEESMEIVRRVYRRDIETFGYHFDETA